MARPRPKHQNRPQDRQAGRPRSGPSQDLPRHPMDRYTAPGDGLIAIESRLILNEAFPFKSGLVHQLQRREVKPKEAFTIRDGSGTFFRASLKDLTPAGGVAVPYERMVRSPEPTIDITLACSVLARQRMIVVMQKATELGVTRIVPLLTEHSVPASGLEHERANAWPAQVIRAAKQCRRSSLPEVCPPISLDAFLVSPEYAAADVSIMLDDQIDNDPAPAERPQRVILFVGPEGGFSDAERLKLLGKARPWFLGGRILRAETAVFVGLTILHMKWGDFAS